MLLTFTIAQRNLASKCNRNLHVQEFIIYLNTFLLKLQRLLSQEY